MRELLHRRFCRAEQHVRDVVGGDAINFFRHGAIEAAQTGFHVYDWNVKLHGGKSARQG